MKQLFLTLLLSVFTLVAAAADEGYETLALPLPTSAGPGEIEVVELFWYGCPHCYNLEPTLSDWVEARPDNVVFKRIPAVFRKGWVPAARAYYTAQILGVEERVHPALFKAIHEHNARLNTVEDIEKIFVAEGVSAEDFRTEYESFGVDRSVRVAIQATRDYQITGVPSIIVNGKYRTTASLAGSNEAMLEVVSQLIAKEALLGV
ncbi:MAG: thiol:disulfide interchange protein DsbA/DsbL, partial [Gammaproteobacteria bacterium]|nr:thiol:disulfide interchange protein DsbA/DsbL [Gammaproteobacteria bacterium]